MSPRECNKCTHHGNRDGTHICMQCEYSDSSYHPYFEEAAE